MMKRILLTCLLALTLCGGALAADNGATLSKEDGQAMAFIQALNTTNSYNAAKGTFSKTLADKVTPAVYAQMQKQLKTNFGTQKEMKLAVLEKFDQGDRLTYIAAYDTNKMARVIIVFGKNGVGGIQNFTIAPLQVAKAQPAK